MGREENGEFCCGYLHFLKSNLTLVVLYSLVTAAGRWRWISSPDCGGTGRQLWGADGIGRGETLSAGETSFFVFPFLSKSHIAALSQCSFSRRPPPRTGGGTAPLGRGCARLEGVFPRPLTRRWCNRGWVGATADSAMGTGAGNSKGVCGKW